MLSDHNSNGGQSQYPGSRKSFRPDDSSSGFLTGSGEISSGQLFVRIPPSETRSPRSPRVSEQLEVCIPVLIKLIETRSHLPFFFASPKAGLPPLPQRSPRRPRPPRIENDTESNTQRIQATRGRTLSSGATTSRPVIDVSRGRQAYSENGESTRGQRVRTLLLFDNLLCYMRAFSNIHDCCFSLEF